MCGTGCLMARPFIALHQVGAAIFVIMVYFLDNVHNADNDDDDDDDEIGSISFGL